MIPHYLKTTNCPYELYADPTMGVYSALGMGKTLDLGFRKPEYIQQAAWKSVVSSVWQGLSWKHGGFATKGGDFWQVGSEWLFQKTVEKGGEGSSGSGKRRWEVKWCHRMQNTRDHAELPEIRRVLGLDAASEVISMRYEHRVTTEPSIISTSSGGEKSNKDGVITSRSNSVKFPRRLSWRGRSHSLYGSLKGKTKRDSSAGGYEKLLEDEGLMETPLPRRDSSIEVL